MASTLLNLPFSEIPVRNFTVQIIAKYSKHLKWNPFPESIMDIGIGDGRVSKAAIFPIVPIELKEYIGCDISESALEFSRTVINDATYHTLLMDIASLNIPSPLNNRCHHIFSNICLHMIQNTRQAFSNMYDILKPGGELLFTVFKEMPIDEGLERMDEGKWMKYDHYKALSPTYKSQEGIAYYEKIANDTGFVNCHFYKEPHKMEFTEEMLNRAFVSVNLRLPLVTDEDKDEYIKDYLNIAKRGSLVTSRQQDDTTIFTLNVEVIIGIVRKPS